MGEVGEDAHFAIWHKKEYFIILSALQLFLNRNLEVDRCGCSSKENLFGESALSMNAMYVVFLLR